MIGLIFWEAQRGHIGILNLKMGPSPPGMAIQVEKMMINDWYNTLYTVHVPFFAQTHVLVLVNLV